MGDKGVSLIKSVYTHFCTFPSGSCLLAYFVNYIFVICTSGMFNITRGFARNSLNSKLISGLASASRRNEGSVIFHQIPTATTAMTPSSTSSSWTTLDLIVSQVVRLQFNYNQNLRKLDAVDVVEATGGTNASKSPLLEALIEGIWLIKRTFQPSLIRRKRKHGFLARVRTKNGRKVLIRRRIKKRSQLCA